LQHFDQCFSFQGTGGQRVFCDSEEYSIKFYVNHQPVPNLSEYIFEDGDKILISYGGETQEKIDSQLAELDAQPILA